MADPPQQQPPPPSPPQPPPKRTKKSKKTGDPRDEPGATVHAYAHCVMGKSPAVHVFGNINYNKTFIRGIVIEKFDSRKPNAKQAQWSLRVRFYPPSHPEGKVYEICVSTANMATSRRVPILNKMLIIHHDHLT